MTLPKRKSRCFLPVYPVEHLFRQPEKFHALFLLIRASPSRSEFPARPILWTLQCVKFSSNTSFKIFRCPAEKGRFLAFSKSTHSNPSTSFFSRACHKVG